MMMKKLNIGNLSISVPIVQGGMGVGISLSGLASAVANEGSWCDFQRRIRFVISEFI